MVKRQKSFTPHESISKRTSIGGGKIKTSSMNKSKRRNKGL